VKGDEDSEYGSVKGMKLDPSKFTPEQRKLYEKEQKAKAKADKKAFEDGQEKFGNTIVSIIRDC